MTKIYDAGDFWIESGLIDVTIGNAAGVLDSAVVNVEKDGHVVGWSTGWVESFGLNDNIEAMSVNMLWHDVTVTPLTRGQPLGGFHVRVTKSAGTDGNIVAVCGWLIYMRY